MSSPDNSLTSRPAPGLRVAALMTLLWAALLIFYGGRALLVPVPAPRLRLLGLIFILIGTGYAAATAGLWRQRQWGGWIAIVLCSVVIAFQFQATTPAARAALVVNVVIVGLVAANWKRLQ